MSERNIYVTLSGLPLSFHLEWPFRRSTSGADFWVLHGDIKLENSEGLHALVSVNLSATVHEVVPSIEPKDIEAPVINALRKEVDKRQLEFLKSGKRVPVQFSSRHYDFKRNAWVFGKASDGDISLLLARKVYWQTRLAGGPVWMGNPTEAPMASLVKASRRRAGRRAISAAPRWGLMIRPAWLRPASRYARARASKSRRLCVSST